MYNMKTKNSKAPKSPEAIQVPKLDLTDPIRPCETSVKYRMQVLGANCECILETTGNTGMSLAVLAPSMKAASSGWIK